MFLSGAYNIVFDIVQFVLRHSSDKSHYPRVRQIFRQNMLAYDIIDIPPDGPTIVPNASPEEGEAIRESFALLRTGPFDGARHHLQQASSFINAGDATKAVAQAMHAVESVVRVIAPNKNVNQALASLNTASTIHHALKEALRRVFATLGWRAMWLGCTCQKRCSCSARVRLLSPTLLLTHGTADYSAGE
jgi:cellobiose-specific phosphotransferase system component IIA